jgi:hypothetical protein
LEKTKYKFNLIPELVQKHILNILKVKNINVKSVDYVEMGNNEEGEIINITVFITPKIYYDLIDVNCSVKKDKRFKI